MGFFFRIVLSVFGMRCSMNGLDRFAGGSMEYERENGRRVEFSRFARLYVGHTLT